MLSLEATPPVKAHGPRCLKPPHPRHEVRLRGLQQEAWPTMAKLRTSAGEGAFISAGSRDYFGGSMQTWPANTPKRRLPRRFLSFRRPTPLRPELSTSSALRRPVPGQSIRRPSRCFSSPLPPVHGRKGPSLPHSACARGQCDCRRNLAYRPAFRHEHRFSEYDSGDEVGGGRARLTTPWTLEPRHRVTPKGDRGKPFRLFF